MAANSYLGAAEAPPSAAILPDNEGRIDSFLMQVGAPDLPAMLPVFRTWLPQLGTHTEGHIICANDDVARRLKLAITAWKLAQPERFHVHTSDAVAHPWARDDFIALRQSPEKTRLLHRPGGEFSPDRKDPIAELLAAELAWLRPEPNWGRYDGGDLVSGRRLLLAGPSVLKAIRMEFPGDEDAALQRRLESRFGRKTLFVPSPGDFDRLARSTNCHLDMYVTWTATDEIVLGDPAWGARLEEQMQREGYALPPSNFAPVDVSPPMALTSDITAAARRTLEAAGLKVHTVPFYAVPRQLYSASYNNVLQEQTPAGPVVYLPQYDAGPLDREAAAVYRSLGYRVAAVDVRYIFVHKGALRCLANVISRSPGAK